MKKKRKVGQPTELEKRQQAQATDWRKKLKKNPPFGKGVITYSESGGWDYQQIKKIMEGMPNPQWSGTTTYTTGSTDEWEQAPDGEDYYINKRTGEKRAGVEVAAKDSVEDWADKWAKNNGGQDEGLGKE